LSEAHRLVHHSRSNFVPVASMACSKNRRKAKTQLDYFSHPWTLFDCGSNLVVDEFIRRFHSQFRQRNSAKHTASTCSTRANKELAVSWKQTVRYLVARSWGPTRISSKHAAEAWPIGERCTFNGRKPWRYD